MTPMIFEAIRNIGKCPAMQALEGLTPMGSEYWEDPEFCAIRIRETRDKLWELLKKKTIDYKNLLDSRSGV